MAERNLDFDKIVERKKTACLKYDFAAKRGMPEDILPLWVADMDFMTSSYVEDALIERAKHGIFGYSDMDDEYFEAVYNWQKKHHNFTIQKDWLIKTPGVVFALAMAIKAFSKEGESVLVQLPVYYPFKEAIEDNKRKLVSSDLYLGDDNRYHIDFSDFENKIVENDIHLFILCNPHNPVGRIWNKEELKKIGEICLKHQVLVVSDEIHNDFVIKGEHNVFATVDERFIDNCIICTSPSKTFNLASMLISNIFIPNPDIRKQFRKQVDAAGISQLSILGEVASKAAYEHGEEWYEKMLSYIKGNVEFAKNYIDKYIPGAKMVDHEGTYLIWIDFRKTDKCPKEIDDLIINKAKLWLDSGKIFGKTGEGFQRINVACPRAILEEALERIRRAFS